MATYPVKYVNNAMRGAPVLNGTAGSLISVLDAFLVTGFGLTTAQSVTVSGGIATATVQAGNSFDKDCIVLVDGATPAVLNGEQRVLTASSTAITFATAAPDGAATGTITVKVAPVGGWEKKFSDTNKAVYRSTDPAGSGFCLRVDDTGTTTARVVGYESMTDVDTGLGMFPTSVQASGGGYLHKSNAANANGVRYALMADSRAVLWCIEHTTPGSTTPRATAVRGFGDPIAIAPNGDLWAAFLSHADSTGNVGNGALSGGSGSSGFTATYMARPLGGIGGPGLFNANPYTGTLSIMSGADNLLGAAPSVVDGKIYLSPVYLRTASGSNEGPRAMVPGVVFVPQTGLASIVSPHDKLIGSGAWDGRTLVAIGVGSSASSAPSGIVFVDITGPWR